jgi:short-subunit dehydrogenase
MRQNILITGASSGIGKALAIIYAKNSNNLFLCARNQEKLAEVKKICNKSPDFKGKIYSYIIDVKDKNALQACIAKIEKSYNLDLVIANAGISAGTSLGIESEEQINEIFATNLNGVLNTINPAIKYMKDRKKGQIAIISSLAGFRGLPSSPAYSASKAAVRVYGEALRGNLAKFGIKVSIVCPGYVKTPMTAVNKFYMPFIIESDKCAKIIKAGLKANKSRIAFPFLLYFVVWLMTLLSPKITDPIFAKLPKKKALDVNLR